MEDSLRKEIATIIEEIEDAFWEEDYDDLIQRFKDIPDVYWKDAACFSEIIKWILPTANDELIIYPIDAIPDWFWEDKNNVLNYFNDLWDFYAADRVHFNLCELIPMRLLNDPEYAQWLLECNVDETLSYMSEDLIAVPKIALSALRGVWLKIQWRNDNCINSWLPPFNERECLNEFFEEIPKTLASSREFVLGFTSSGYFADDLDMLFDWIDEELWSDRDVAFEALSDDSEALEYVSNDLLQDVDFVQKIKEELNISID